MHIIDFTNGSFNKEDIFCAVDGNLNIWQPAPGSIQVVLNASVAHQRLFWSTPNGVLTAHAAYEWLPGVRLRHSVTPVQNIKRIVRVGGCLAVVHSSFLQLKKLLRLHTRLD